MKRYGMNQATEFSRKQIGVIFANAKKGSLKVEKWAMSRMYDLADFYGMDSNGSIAKEEQRIKAILDKIFAGNMEGAQEEIDAYTEIVFGEFTTKAQASFDRSFIA